ncbi:hypothetical protein KEM52_000795, partial [Ascosphaera acerosa]
MPATFRRPLHAGSWYTDDAARLRASLDAWLDEAAASPSAQAKGRVIIAPHAGYAYSGPCAAYAYNALDLTGCTKIYLLGPSHHQYSTQILLPHPSVAGFRTPLSAHTVPYDHATIARIRESDPALFGTMARAAEEREHSLEMQLPYIHRLLQRNDEGIDKYPPIIPMMVGATSKATERAAGAALAPLLADPTAAVIVSSDFCHWGARFGYTFYSSHAGHPAPALPLGVEALPQADGRSRGDTAATVRETVDLLEAGGMELEAEPGRGGTGTGTGNGNGGYFPPPEIHESITAVDLACMRALTLPPQGCQALDAFRDAMARTQGNTICGRHPICVVLAAIAHI